MESAGSIQRLGFVTELQNLWSTLRVGDTERLRLKYEIFTWPALFDEHKIKDHHHPPPFHLSLSR